MRGSGELWRGQPVHQPEIGRQASGQLRWHGRLRNLPRFIGTPVHGDDHCTRSPRCPILIAQQRCQQLHRRIGIARNAERNSVAPRDFGRRSILGGGGIICLGAHLIAEQIKSETAVSEIGALQPAQRDGCFEKAHRLRRVLKLHHRRAQRCLDDRIARRQRLRSGEETERGTRITQHQRRSPSLCQGAGIGTTAGDFRKRRGQLLLSVRPRNGGWINRLLRAGSRLDELRRADMSVDEGCPGEQQRTPRRRATCLCKKCDHQPAISTDTRRHAIVRSLPLPGSSQRARAYWLD
jgi:hypothetical protein